MQVRALGLSSVSPAGQSSAAAKVHRAAARVSDMKKRESRPRFIVQSIVVAGALVLAATTLAAQDFPSRPLRIIVPYAAGGPSDTGARLVAEPLGRELGRPVVVENRGGGGGLNATDVYLNSEQDGHTILVGSIGPLTIIPALKPVPYDVARDVIPLATVWRSAQVLAVRPNLGANGLGANGLGVKSVAEFVAYAKTHPNKVTIGSAGIGAVTHLAIELTQREAAVDLVHIPFRSTSESLPQLLGGQTNQIEIGPVLAAF